jgi:diguanylate cyclase (GGDEF)-like protein
LSGKILIVDDSTFNLKLLQAILEKEDYEVFVTGNSLEVVDMAIAVKPSAILLDIVMPGLDGFELCRLLKKEPEVMDVPVIIVTGKTDTKDIKTAFDLGAFDYIRKPLDQVEVIARVKSALRFKEQQDMLKEMAFKDGLTGLFNHAVLMELFEKEVNKQERNKRSISFMMLDIDFFKKVNDTYGHLAGDMIIKQVADIIKNSVRDSDIVGRYGGEEFGVVLSETNAQEAGQVSERIRQTVENNSFDIGTEKVKITLSIGIYTKDYAEALGYKEVIKRADEALYKAKQNGRNRVEHF